MRLLFLLPIIALTACEPGFDRARWAAARGVDARDNPRGTMVCDAVRAGLVPGAHKDDVRALLGAPDDESPVVDIYEIGLEAFYWDEIILGIQYDDGSVVEEVGLTHDWGHESLRPRVPGTCGGNWSFVRDDN